MLEHELLVEYLQKAKNGDEQAKHVLFEENSPLIKSIIRRFKNKGVEYDDLYQIACIGFLKAINNFDFSFNVKFSTYTVPMVIGEIKRYMRDNGAIKVSRSLKSLANKISRYIDEYQTKNSDAPSVENIAKYFNVEQDDVVLALDSVRMPISLFDRFSEDEDGQELLEKIPCVDNEESMLNKIQLSTIIDGLNERERKIVVLRYYRDKTQGEVANALGVSQVQISRLENKILEKIRQCL